MPYYATPLHPVIFTLESLWVHGLELTDREQARDVLVALKRLADNHDIKTATIELYQERTGLVAKVSVEARSAIGPSIDAEYHLPIHHLG